MFFWQIKSVYPEEPFTKIIQMMDGHRLLKFAYRVWAVMLW